MQAQAKQSARVQEVDTFPTWGHLGFCGLPLLYPPSLMLLMFYVVLLLIQDFNIFLFYLYSIENDIFIEKLLRNILKKLIRYIQHVLVCITGCES